MIKENILAIPSKDRLRDESLNLMKSIAINFEYTLGWSGIRNLTSEATLIVADANSMREWERFTVALLRPKDIVEMVAASEIPLGIVGMDTVEEYSLSLRRNLPGDEKRVQTLLPLGIGVCRLVLAAPQESGIKTAQEFREAEQRGEFVSRLSIPTLEQFRGLTIATSYPRMLRRYFADAYASLDTRDSMEFSIREMIGAVEAAPALGMAGAIADLVETGTSLRDNGLREIETIFESQAVLITNTQNKKGDDPFVDKVRDTIFRFLLKRGNPDAIRKQQEYEEFISSYR